MCARGLWPLPALFGEIWAPTFGFLTIYLMLRFTPPSFAQRRILKDMKQSAVVEAAFARWCSWLCLTDGFKTDVCESVTSWALEPLGNTHWRPNRWHSLIWAAFGPFRTDQLTNSHSLASLSLSWSLFWSLFHRSHQTIFFLNFYSLFFFSTYTFPPPLLPFLFSPYSPRAGASRGAQDRGKLV